MLDASNRTFTASITRSHFFYEFPIATPPGRPNLSQSQYLSGLRIDQVHLRARCAGDGFISLSFAFGWIVSVPSVPPYQPALFG